MYNYHLSCQLLIFSRNCGKFLVKFSISYLKVKSTVLSQSRPLDRHPARLEISAGIALFTDSLKYFKMLKY